MTSSQSPDGDAYNEAYYRSHCGPVPYKRDDHWLGFFGSVADTIVRSFAPRKVFDAGCAIGLLVECLWDRGVETYGRDISVWAIEQARPDIRACLQSGSIADPIEGEFDLITCIEVLEHLEGQQAERAIHSIAASTSRVLFSSSPVDFDEPTHINVRPTLYWLELWAAVGFAPSVTHDCGYLAPHAYILERSEEGRSYRDLIAFADRIRHRVALSMLGASRTALESDRIRLQALLDKKDSETDAKSKALSKIRETLKIEAIELKRKLRNAEARNIELSQSLSEFQARQSHLETRASQLQHHLDHATKDRDFHHAAHTAISNSTTWKSASRIASLPLLSSPVSRRIVRKGINFCWRVASMKFIADRASLKERLNLLQRSEYFDPDWYRNRYEDVANSRIDPTEHYAKFGYLEGRIAHPYFNTELYLSRHSEYSGGIEEVFLDAIRSRTFLDGVLQGAPAEAALFVSHELASQSFSKGDIFDPSPGEGAHDIIARRFPDLTPLAVYASPGVRYRVSVVTDSIGRESLYGGVGTALIFAALVAKRIGAELRIITRSEESSPTPLTALYSGAEVVWDGNIEVIYSPKGFGEEGHSVPVCDKDYFITTSWWTTRATMKSVDKRKIITLVQEDERMFYPYGDELLLCTEVFQTPETLKVVNSNLLLDHFHKAGLFTDAIAFEPSFPETLYFKEPRSEERKEGKKRFFFYARPNNSRNLFYRGLEVLTACIERGILDPQEWDFYLAGHGTGAISLPNGARTIIPGVMTWPEYAEFIRGMDLGLSLMYTPHPSYPPLDLAASGCVVVTNKFGLKENLDQYSENIICAEPSLEALIAAVRDAVTLSASQDLKDARYARNKVSRDWASSMSHAIERVASWIED